VLGAIEPQWFRHRPGLGRFPYSLNDPKESLRCVNHRQSTHHSACDNQSSCTGELIGYDQDLNMGSFDPEPNIIPLDHRSLLCREINSSSATSYKETRRSQLERQNWESQLMINLNTVDNINFCPEI
jgi:hypothetical protein